MKHYDLKHVCEKFTKHVYDNFKTATLAAEHYKVTSAFISNIKREISPPNAQMLRDIGFEFKSGFIKNGRKK